MNRQEKYQLVSQLYKEGKTMREISKEVHMSFSDIGAIIKRIKVSEQDKEVSYDIQAIKMFLKGKKQADVAIKLDLPSEDVLYCYKQYLQLQNMEELNKIYDEIGGRLHDFIDFYRLSKKLNVNVNQILYTLRAGKDIPFQTMS